MATVTTAFGPEQGLRFVNRFDLPFALRVPVFGALNLGRLVLGVCGGMCFAALDYFYAGRPAPEIETPPAPGSALHRYLWTRQWASMGGVLGIGRILWWMLRRDETAARLTVAREWPKLAARLAAGEPAALLLVRAGGLSDPTQNHQVVVWGYDTDEETGRVSLRLYDPNHPPRNPAAPPPRIEFTPDAGAPGENGPALPMQNTGEPLRGFFVLDYEAATAGLPEA